MVTVGGPRYAKPMRGWKIQVAAGMAIALGLGPRSASAQPAVAPAPGDPSASSTVSRRGAESRPSPQPELRWNEQDRRAGWANLVFVGVTGGIALAGEFIEPRSSSPWQQTLGVDEDVRNSLRLTDASDRRLARTTSDILAGVVVTYPVIDIGVNVAWAKRSADVAAELAVMQLEVLGVTAALVGTSKWAFSRERPYGRLCGAELSEASKDCRDSDRYLSYFSGHTAFTFGSASALCVHHARFELWGASPPWVACSTGYALAATTALLRVGADRHYVSDVATGAVVGTAVGLLVPWFHYRSGQPAGAGRAAWNVGWTGSAITVGGRF